MFPEEEGVGCYGVPHYPELPFSSRSSDPSGDEGSLYIRQSFQRLPLTQTLHFLSFVHTRSFAFQDLCRSFPLFRILLFFRFTIDKMLSPLPPPRSRPPPVSCYFAVCRSISTVPSRLQISFLPLTLPLVRFPHSLVPIQSHHLYPKLTSLAK